MSKVIYKLGDDISTDIIYPGRYMATVLPTETPLYAFDDMKDLNKMLQEKPKDESAIIICGKNFGCGSSREQAASTLKGTRTYNYRFVIFARIFLQNSINLGLKTVICPSIEAETDDEIEISNNAVINKSTGKGIFDNSIASSKTGNC